MEPPAKRPKCAMTLRSSSLFISQPDKPANSSSRKRKVSKSSQNLQNLNIDCLWEIFQHMSVIELCDIAEVCVGLKLASQRYVQFKHRYFDLASLVDPTTGKYQLKKVRQLLYNFGHLFKTLVINHDMLHDREEFGKVIQLVSKYCLHSVEKLIFENQPNDRLSEFMAISFMCTEKLMASGISEVHTYTKLIFTDNKTIQVQTT